MAGKARYLSWRSWGQKARGERTQHPHEAQQLILLLSFFKKIETI